MKILKYLYLSVIISMLWINICAADVTKTADALVYKVTLNKVEFYNSTTGGWETAGSGDMTFDIAASGAGAVAGGYASGSPLPQGSYTKVKVTLKRQFTIKASYADTSNAFSGGATKVYYTDTTNTNDANSVDTNTTGPAAEGTAKIPDAAEALLPATESFVAGGVYLAHEETLSTPLNVQKEYTRKTRVSFNVSNVITFSKPTGASFIIAYPGPPTVTMTTYDSE